MTEQADQGCRWTTPDHVRTRYEGTLGAEHEARLSTWLADAEDILVGRVPGLACRIASGAVSVREVQRIVASAVIRYLRNPAGVTQRSTGEGSFNSSVSYAQPAAGSTSAAAGITFTEDELAALRPAGLPPGFGVARSRPSPQWAGFGDLYSGPHDPLPPGAER